MSTLALNHANVDIIYLAEGVSLYTVFIGTTNSCSAKACTYAVLNLLYNNETILHVHYFICMPAYRQHRAAELNFVDLQAHWGLDTLDLLDPLPDETSIYSFIDILAM